MPETRGLYVVDRHREAPLPHLIDETEDDEGNKTCPMARYLLESGELLCWLPTGHEGPHFDLGDALWWVDDTETGRITPLAPRQDSE